MIFLFYSPDFGFLKNKVEDFKKKHGSCKILKNPEAIEDVAAVLLQQNIFNSLGKSIDSSSSEDVQSFIIEEFSFPIKSLESVLKQVDRQKIHVLIVKTTTKNAILKINPRLFDNKDLRIEGLTKKTQREYIGELNKSINLGANDLRLINSKINKSVTAINDLFRDINTYKLTKPINKEVLNSLLAFHNSEVSYFDFFSLYFSQNPSDWIEFLSENLIRPSDTTPFLRAFSYKLYDFYTFLHPCKNKSGESTEKPKHKFNLFAYSEYKKICANYENRIKNYLNDLIYKFVLFTSLSFGLNKSVFDIYYFLFINHINCNNGLQMMTT